MVLCEYMYARKARTEMELLSMQWTHHRNVSVVLITKNLYPRGVTRQDHRFKYDILCINEEFVDVS